MSIVIEVIQERVRNGNYLVKSHAVTHALKEGFERRHLIEAVLSGKIIEENQDDQRVLICGKADLTDDMQIYLHVVCEYADPVYTEFVTAYLPDESQWEDPPFKRRKRKKK
jgi:hypothetical protein